MKLVNNRVVWGLLLIAGGVLFLLQNMELLPESGAMWAIAIGVIGLYFLAIFLVNPVQWWTAFPAFGSLGIAATIVISEMTSLPDEWAGAAFLGLVGLGFLAIYLRHREHWWPLIPGGAMLSLGAVVLVSTTDGRVQEALVPGILFSGMALTFLLVSIAPSAGGRAAWAIWPAAGFLAIAFMTGLAAFELALPIILIVLGVALLVRPALRRR